jgi:CRISPR-associated protein Csn2
MKIVHSDIENQFVFNGKINTLVIEENHLFCQYCYSVYEQINEELGKFVLSDKDEILSFPKNVEILTDYFALSLNDKKFIAKLYKHLQGIANEKLYKNGNELTSLIVNFLEELNSESDYPIDYNIESGISEILKAFNVKLSADYSNILEKIIAYINALINLTSVKLIIFVNLKCFLSDDELKNLYQFIKYNEVSVLFLENSIRTKIDDEFIVVIDKDLCEIIV